MWFDFEAGHDGLFSCFSLLVVSLCLSHRAFFLATLHARSFTFCEPKSRFLGGCHQTAPNQLLGLGCLSGRGEEPYQSSLAAFSAFLQKTSCKIGVSFRKLLGFFWDKRYCKSINPFSCPRRPAINHGTAISVLPSDS